ncbi:NAD(P)/FAD-dependent oxidoreductase [Neptunomonas antarctica]|uniref:Glycine/D-amino acid oxidase n=1 Tax=Neptunomonas antarctica TaxID=619304 RepID=A0A1N7M3K4_9GAMM|nr:FAD-dependent oxidoreductase [Neptunomonas antarctica]SIS80706.1 Glycine/D-amino acid oxidase [Neptunomonas antarctica]
MILPQYDGRCGWYELLGSVSEFSALNDDTTFDTVVIGGGFVGTAAARRLAENCPDDKVLLIDALKVGQGASGRNSGFVIDQPHKRDLERADDVFKNKIIQLNRAAIEYLEHQIDNFGIDCQWSRVGKYQGAVGPRGEKYLNNYEQLLRNSGEPYERLSKAEAQAVFGTDYYNAAIYTPGGTLVQPAALMRGLADSLPANVRVVENTPVLEICRQPSGFKLKTRNATITCKQLIVATSIFTPELGFMKNRILPVMTFASMTRPLTDAEMSLYGGQLDWGMTPADHAGTTMRMTQDRRLIIRNSYRYAPDYNTPAAVIPGIQERHREGLEHRYPTLKHVGIEYTWGGATSLSANFETYFGKLEEGIYSSGCDQSVGAARGTISGMMLADMLSGRHSKLLTNMQEVSGSPSRLPPKPLLRIGVPLRMAMARLASRTEI